MIGSSSSHNGVLMDRRTILRGLATAAVAAPAAGLLGAGPAEAATYYVMATEQASGRILRFNSAAWTGGTTLVLQRAIARPGLRREQLAVHLQLGQHGRPRQGVHPVAERGTDLDHPGLRRG
jgi:hypothetical protein